MYIGNKKRNR